MKICKKQNITQDIKLEDAQQQQSDALWTESCCSIQLWKTWRFFYRLNSNFQKRCIGIGKTFM